MIQFIIIMIILDILMKIPVGKPAPQAPAAPERKEHSKTAYVCGNTAAWDFKTLDDAMEFRELRLSGWKGNAIDFYKWKEEE